MWSLSPCNEVELPFSGASVRAAFLRLLENFNERNAKRLHDYEGIKPYSATPVYVGHVFKPELKIRLDRIYRFRVSLLQENVFESFLKWLANMPTSEVIIGSANFVIRKVSLHRVEFEELLKGAEAIHSFRIHFYTPTYFSKWGVDFHEPFPTPVSVFHNLINTWKAFSPVKFDCRGFREWVDKSVMISGYLLKTWKPIDIGSGRWLIGFTGWCNYKITKNKDYNMKEHEGWCRLTYTLGMFAEIANVGGNRTGGFGVVKFIPKTEG
jgi:CRISPR-associated endoribonuclease Cas6